LRIPETGYLEVEVRKRAMGQFGLAHCLYQRLAILFANRGFEGGFSGHYPIS
jgi:hypothetical protein